MNKLLEKIEKDLGVLLPTYYKETIEHYPFKPLDNLDFVEDNLVKEYDWIVNSNKELRESGFFGNMWPTHFFAIGHDGFGNFYFLNLKDDSSIYFADHEYEFDQKDISDMVLTEDMKEFIEICLEGQQYVINNA